MFEKFSVEARNALVGAREAAFRLGCEFIGPEHLLLAILSDKSGGAVRALDQVKAPVATLRAEVQKLCPKGRQKELKQLPFSPDVKALIEGAERAATEMKQPAVLTGHFVVADLDNPLGVLPRFLLSLGIDRLELRRRLIERMAAKP